MLDEQLHVVCISTKSHIFFIRTSATIGRGLPGINSYPTVQLKIVKSTNSGLGWFGTSTSWERMA